MVGTAAALVRAAHPGPSLVLTAIAVGLGIGVALPPDRLVLLGAASLAHQLSVGWSNDWFDADRDAAAGRSSKPLVSGAIGRTPVLLAALVAVVLALGLTAPLGPSALAAHALFIGAGWAYNAGLKRTLASVLAYAVGFAMLPTVVTLALPTAALPAGWAVAAAALLGVAAHCANALPDLPTDRATGIHGLPQRLGPRGCAVVISAALVGAVLCVTLGPGSIDGWRAGAAAVVTATAIASGVLILVRPTTRVVFALILGAALTIVVLLIASGRVLVG